VADPENDHYELAND